MALAKVIGPAPHWLLPSASRVSSIPLKAMYVLNKTIGLMTGPAKRYATQLLRGKPLRSNLRMIGMIPHSHIGKTNPRKPPAKTPMAAFFGNILPKSLLGKNSSSNPAIIAPSTMKGKAS